MSDTPGSPRASRLSSPRWLDTRLVLGVLLVLGSVLVGARVLSSADRSQQVWVTTRDLAPGTVLMTDDLRSAQVRLFGSTRLYAGAGGAKPTGYVVRLGLGSAELLPLAALARPDEDVVFRNVTVPVPVGHLPPELGHGEQVDVYVTPSDKAARLGTSGKGAAALLPRLVLKAVTVQRVVRAGGLGASSQDQPVLLTVRPDEVLSLVSAMSLGQIDLVEVPRAQQADGLSPATAP